MDRRIVRAEPSLQHPASALTIQPWPKEKSKSTVYLNLYGSEGSRRM